MSTNRVNFSTPPVNLLPPQDFFPKQFPQEILFQIFARLGKQDIASLAQCSKRLHTLSNAPTLWKMLLKRDYPLFSLKGIKNENFKSEYKRIDAIPSQMQDQIYSTKVTDESCKRGKLFQKASPTFVTSTGKILAFSLNSDSKILNVYDSQVKGKILPYEIPFNEHQCVTTKECHCSILEISPDLCLFCDKPSQKIYVLDLTLRATPIRAIIPCGNVIRDINKISSQQFVCSLTDGTLEVWELKNEKPRKLASHEAEGSSPTLFKTPDFTISVTEVAPKTIKIWDFTRLEDPCLFSFQGDAIYKDFFQTSKKVILFSEIKIRAGKAKNTIKIVDLRKAKPSVRNLKVGVPRTIAEAPHGQILINEGTPNNGARHKVSVWDFDLEKAQQEVKTHDEVNNFFITSNGLGIFEWNNPVVSNDKKLIVKDLNNEKSPIISTLDIKSDSCITFNFFEHTSFPGIIAAYNWKSIHLLDFSTNSVRQNKIKELACIHFNSGKLKEIPQGIIIAGDNSLGNTHLTLANLNEVHPHSIFILLDFSSDLKECLLTDLIPAIEVRNLNAGLIPILRRLKTLVDHERIPSYISELFAPLMTQKNGLDIMTPENYDLFQNYGRSPVVEALKAFAESLPASTSIDELLQDKEFESNLVDNLQDQEFLALLSNLYTPSKNHQNADGEIDSDGEIELDPPKKRQKTE